MQVKLKHYQNDFIFSRNQFPAMISSWATGKTMCGILRAVFYSEQIPQNLGVIFRKEYVDLRDSTIQDFEKYTGLKVNSQREVVFPNKSKIMFRHVEEVNNIQNVNLGWFLVEQIDELESDKEWWMLWGRLRREVTPAGEFNKYNLPKRSGFVIANAGREWIHELWEDKCPENFQCVKATTFDNKDVLPEDFIRNLEIIKQNKPAIYRRYVLNERDVLENEFILIPPREMRKLENIEVYRGDIRQIISCDPALDGDFGKIMVMENGKIIEKMTLHVRDTMKIAGHLCVLANKHGIYNFIIDVIGIGKGVADRVREVFRHKINNNEGQMIEQNSSEKADTPEEYYNQRAEMWGYVSKQVYDGNVPHPCDHEVVRDVTCVRYLPFKSSGVIKLEPKSETKKRLDRSPDDGDCWIMGQWGLTKVRPVKQKKNDYHNKQNYEDYETGAMAL